MQQFFGPEQDDGSRRKLRRITLSERALTRSLGALLTTTLWGCAEQAARNPLDCRFAEYVYATSAEASRPVEVEFSTDWGTAPSRMNVRVVDSAWDKVDLLGCGRDAQNREWELQAVWLHLPVPAAYPLDIEFFADEALRDNAPDFAGSLLRCSEYGCGSVDRIAFVRKGKSNVGGTSRVEQYDAQAGRFVANLTADAGEPLEQPPARLKVNIEWNPAETGPEFDAGKNGDGAVDAANDGG